MLSLLSILVSSVILSSASGYQFQYQSQYQSQYPSISSDKKISDLSRAEIKNTNRISPCATQKFNEPLWTGKQLNRHIINDGHLKRINSVVFSPDGKWLASAGDDSKVIIWDLKGTLDSEDKIIKTILSNKEQSSITSIAFSPDGKWLASVRLNGAIELWDWQKRGDKKSYQLKKKTSEEFSSVPKVSFSPSGEVLAVSTNKTIELWDVSSKSPKSTITEKGNVATFQFSPDGKSIASAIFGSEITLWEIDSGKPLFDPIKEPYTIYTIQFSPDGNKIFGAGANQQIKSWSSQTGLPLINLSINQSTVVSSMALSPTGETLISGDFNNFVTFWNLSKSKEVCRVNPYERKEKRTPYSRGISFISFSSDGKMIAADDGHRGIVVWTLETLKN
jgi:WD40 repeat protein